MEVNIKYDKVFRRYDIVIPIKTPDKEKDLVEMVNVIKDYMKLDSPGESRVRAIRFAERVLSIVNGKE